MAEQRFYERREYVCPRCWRSLLWVDYPDTVPDRQDSLMLVHRGENCPNVGKYFYPPVVTLPEIPEEMRK